MHDAVLNSALCASLSAFMVFSRDTDLLDCRVDAGKTRTLDQQTNFSVVTGVYCILSSICAARRTLAHARGKP